MQGHVLDVLQEPSGVDPFIKHKSVSHEASYTQSLIKHKEASGSTGLYS